jgi:hypothetical protein
VNALEQRLYESEKAIRKLQDQVAQLTQRVGALEQNQFASQGAGGGISGAGQSCFFYAGTSVIPAATGLPGVGTPGGPVTGQTVYLISGGGFVSFSTNASIYNGLMSPTVTGKGHVLNQNPDGTFSVVAESCI